MEKKKTHTLMVSDFHLGSKVSRSKELAELLENFSFKKLILLGDIFEELDLSRLKEPDWKLLSLLSELSQKKKVRWIEGNHDIGLTNFFSLFTNIRVYKTYKWKYKGRKCIAIHGHQFDNFLVDNAVISFLANQIYNFIQVVDFKDKRVSRFIKRRSKGWLRLSEKVANRAILYAKVLGYNYIFCGHTHKAMQLVKRNVHYYNSGCWTDNPSTYITMDEDKVEIHEYV